MGAHRVTGLGREPPKQQMPNEHPVSGSVVAGRMIILTLGQTPLTASEIGGVGGQGVYPNGVRTILRNLIQRQKTPVLLVM